MPCFYVLFSREKEERKVPSNFISEKKKKKINRDSVWGKSKEEKKRKMALEAVVFQQNPFGYGCEDYNFDTIIGDYSQEKKPNVENLDICLQQADSTTKWDFSPPSSLAHNTNSSPETCDAAADGLLDGGGYAPVVASSGRRKRRRTKNFKNKEEMENQRMTHIAVERNRRRQMNDYLAVLRSLMPPSYAQRGDQASIVGGAINFVKELEQHVQFLEGHKQAATQQKSSTPPNNSQLFSNFFTFPQYSISNNSITTTNGAAAAAVERRPGIADIEVTMVESHANIKILAKRRPKQLLKMVSGFQSICLTILHLNVTTVDQCVLYSFSVKVEDECQLSTVNEIATAVHEIVGMIQEDSIYV